MPESFDQAKRIYHQASEAKTVRVSMARSSLLLTEGLSLITLYLCGAIRDGVLPERLSCPVAI